MLSCQAMSTTSCFARAGRGLSLAALSLSLLASIPSARADVADDEEAIRDNYAAYAKSLKALQPEPIIAMETWDYTDRSVKGRVLSKQQADDLLRQVFGFIRSVPRAEIKVVSISFKDDVATVVATQRLRLVMVDPRGKEHVLTSEGRVRDTWVNSSSGWHVRISQSLSGVGKMDGRTIPGS